MRHTKTSLKLRMTMNAVCRLTLLTEDWNIDSVYPPDQEHHPAVDQDLLIGLLEDARDVWKPYVDASLEAEDGDDTIVSPPPFRS